MFAKMKVSLLAALLMLVMSTSAHALSVTAPLSIGQGAINCTNCTTSSPTLTANGILYGGGTKTIGGVAINATGTTMYLQQVSSGTPAFAQIAIGDLASMTSAALFGKISDETGSSSGSPLAVFSVNPSLTGVTVTGTADLTGATVNLPAGAVDAITEIATGIKSAGASAVKVATVGSTALVNGQCVTVDSNLNLVPTGSACATAAGVPNISMHSETPVTVLNATPMYMSVTGQGGISSVESDERTPFQTAKTFSNFTCTTKPSTTNAVIATIGTAACTSSANVTSKATVTISTTANTVVNGTGSTTVNAGECAVIKLTAATDATAADFICSVDITG